MVDGVRFAEPGKFEELACSVCGDIMDVKRNVNGPTSWGGAMAKIFHLHDAFACPCREEMWHIQVCRLRDEARKCPSKQIANIMTAEATEVLISRKETKEVSRFF